MTEPAQADAQLEAIRKQYWDATHNCYALRIGPNAGIARSSDDGEPSGTAGMPILQCMASIGVTDALVVVTRYFGGILLGAGGLVRAYAHTASGAIQAANPVRMTPCRDIRMEIPYPLWAIVERSIRDSGCIVRDVAYGESVTAWVLQTETDAEQWIGKILDRTDGRVRPAMGETVFYPIPEPK